MAQPALEEGTWIATSFPWNCECWRAPQQCSHIGIVNFLILKPPQNLKKRVLCNKAMLLYSFLILPPIFKLTPASSRLRVASSMELPRPAGRRYLCIICPLSPFLCYQLHPLHFNIKGGDLKDKHLPVSTQSIWVASFKRECLVCCSRSKNFLTKLMQSLRKKQNKIMTWNGTWICNRHALHW